MRLRSTAFVALLLTAVSAVVIVPTTAFAQFGGGGGGLGGGGGGLGGGGGGGTLGTGGASGVMVDASGVLQRNLVADPTGQLTRQRIAEAQANRERDLAKPSKLRKVSLTRLEAQVAAAGSADDAMQHLAGLTQIDYVLC